MSGGQHFPTFFVLTNHSAVLSCYSTLIGGCDVEEENISYPYQEFFHTNLCLVELVCNNIFNVLLATYNPISLFVKVVLLGKLYSNKFRECQS